MLRLVPLDAAWSKSLLVLAALPTGSLVFVLSSRYGVYTQRSTGVILATTLASVASAWVANDDWLKKFPNSAAPFRVSVGVPSGRAPPALWAPK